MSRTPVIDLQRLYRHRFDAAEITAKARVWQVLCDSFFSRWVRASDTVVDIGAGYCEFINNIRAARKFAVDLNPDVRNHAAQNVEVVNEPCTALASLENDCADVVFMSNFLEHLPTKDVVFETLREARRLLKPGGRLMILQPNIRYLPGAYWDFFDHHTPLTDKSLAEALGQLGMQVDVQIPRFLPYTTKSRLPQTPFLIKLYLKVPLAWRILGRQAFVVALKRP